MRFKMNKKGIDSYTFALKNRLSYIKSAFVEEMKGKLENYSPKRTGRLASSYILLTYPNNIQILNVCGYCKYVNDGTRFQTGQHFIEQAYIESKAKLNLIVRNSLNIGK